MQSMTSQIGHLSLNHCELIYYRYHVYVVWVCVCVCVCVGVCLQTVTGVQ